jgi:S-adenosylmethionine hydrolase
MQPSHTIALITDFGLTDPFVGIMKGVILGTNPDARIVDISHGIGAGDLQGAALSLRMAFPYLPLGTTFVVVVDPGVGTKRRAVAACIGGRFIVCPDNGILSWLLFDNPATEIVDLNRSEFFRSAVSHTFHGRDIFAPVAAHLSMGVDLKALGDPIDDPVLFEIPTVAVTDRTLQGSIVYIDRFGNLITNITRSRLGEWINSIPGGRITVNLGSVEIHGISDNYGSVACNHAVAVFGSMDTLEIAINGGRASDSFGATVGGHVLVYRLTG